MPGEANKEEEITRTSARGKQKDIAKGEAKRRERQQEEERMQVEHKWTWQKMVAMGNVVEAVGGICHAWRKDSRVIHAYLAAESGVPAMEFKKVGDVLGQLARYCRPQDGRQEAPTRG